MLNARVHRRLQSGPVAGGPRQVGPSLSSSRRSVRAAAAEAAAPEVKIDVSTPSGQASLTTESGQETLRAALVAQKVDLYDMWGKVMNCGGGGSCGTCIVEVLEGADLLSERTAGEDKKLKGKPDSWRLACQAIVGDGEKGGCLKVKTQPKK